MAADNFVMTPEEIAQCVAAPELKDFYHDDAVDEKAVEDFIKHGLNSRVDGIVNAMPARLREYLKAKLKSTWGVSLYKNGRDLLSKL